MLLFVGKFTIIIVCREILTQRMSTLVSKSQSYLLSLNPNYSSNQQVSILTVSTFLCVKLEDLNKVCEILYKGFL